jgi:hypothetical protein
VCLSCCFMDTSVAVVWLAAQQPDRHRCAQGLQVPAERGVARESANQPRRPRQSGAFRFCSFSQPHATVFRSRTCARSQWPRTSSLRTSRSPAAPHTARSMPQHDSIRLFARFIAGSWTSTRRARCSPWTTRTIRSRRCATWTGTSSSRASSCQVRSLRLLQLCCMQHHAALPYELTR